MEKYRLRFMIRIDIFGAPGSGKTTLLNALVEKKKKKRVWLTSIEAKHKILHDNFSKKEKNILDYIKDIIYRYKNGKFTPSYDNKKLKNFFSNKISKYNEFIDLAIKIIGNDKNSPTFVKAKRINWLYSTLQDIILLENYHNDQIILFDESLLNRSLYLISNYHTKDQNLLKKLSIPYAFIYMKLDFNNIYKRLKSRKKITLDHSRMSDEELIKKIEKDIHYSEFTYLKLQNYGVEGLVVDCLLPIEENLRKIDNYLSDKIKKLK